MDQAVIKRVTIFDIWPEEGQTFGTILKYFKKPNPKVRIIFDCSELFLEVPDPPLE